MAKRKGDRTVIKTNAMMPKITARKRLFLRYCLTSSNFVFSKSQTSLSTDDSYTASSLTMSCLAVQKFTLLVMAARKKGRTSKRSEAEKEILRKFGNNVRAYRHKLEIAQDELAFRSGIHRTYIGAVERGEYNITLLNICRLAAHLNCKTTDLLKGLEIIDEKDE